VAVGLFVLILVVTPLLSFGSAAACPGSCQMVAVRANDLWTLPRFDDSWRAQAGLICRVHAGAGAQVLPIADPGLAQLAAEKGWLLVTVNTCQLFRSCDGVNKSTGQFTFWQTGWVLGRTFGY